MGAALTPRLDFKLPVRRPSEAAPKSRSRDTYSHVMPGMQEEAAEKIDTGLRKALAG